jgi:hypothetical protein
MIALKWVRSRDGRRALLVPAEADGLEDAPHVVFAVDANTLAQNPAGVRQVLAARGYPPIPDGVATSLVVTAVKEEWEL